MLKSSINRIGYARSSYFQVNGTLSKKQSMKNGIKVKEKLIRVWAFFARRNRYFGTLIFEKIGALSSRTVIPWVEDSLKT